MDAKRKTMIVLAAVLVTAVVAAFVWPREREPEYQGKKLSEWLELGWLSHRGSVEQEEASDAIRHIGSNSVPYLVSAVRYRPSVVRRVAIQFEAVLPRGLRTRRLTNMRTAPVCPGAMPRSLVSECLGRRRNAPFRN